MKAPLLLLLLAGLAAGCATGTKQSGNLARALAQPLKEYGAPLPGVRLDLPSLGIDQLYTSWRETRDPGGFQLTFSGGVWDGVLHQVKTLAGKPWSSPDGSLHIWQIERVAQLDLTRLPDGRAQLTCRRLPGG